MPIHPIESLDDPRLEPFRSLKRTNATRWADRFVAEGDKLVRRLLASGFRLHSLLLAENCVPAFADRIPPEVDVLVVPDAWVEAIVGFNFHRGVLACAHRKPAVDLLTLCRTNSRGFTLVVCPDLHDPTNLGSVIRTASALGISGLVLGAGCCDPFSRRVLRVSMGASLVLPIVESRDLRSDLEALRHETGAELWAAVADRSAAPFDRTPRPARMALLVGNEAHGLADSWLAAADRQITVPMQPGIDSLNAAVAAGILLYGLSRQPPA